MGKKKHRATQVEYTRHEVLERMFMLTELVRIIRSHPALNADHRNDAFTLEQVSEINNLLDSAENSLSLAYMKVGEIHL